MNRILKETPNYSTKYAKRIVGLRNQIILEYNATSDENIWSIVINHLPRLQEEIELKINNSTL